MGQQRINAFANCKPAVKQVFGCAELLENILFSYTEGSVKLLKLGCVATRFHNVMLGSEKIRVGKLILKPKTNYHVVSYFGRSIKTSQMLT